MNSRHTNIKFTCEEENESKISFLDVTITREEDARKTFRSSRPDVFCKKGFLRNFAKFPGKYLCQSFFFNKVAAFRLATLLKKRLWHPVNFAKFLRTPFFTEHLRWLLLNLKGAL